MSYQYEKAALGLLRRLQHDLHLDSSYMSMHKDKPQGARVGMVAGCYWVEGIKEMPYDAKGHYVSLAREIDTSLRAIMSYPEKDGYQMSRVKKGDPIWMKLEDSLGSLAMDFQDHAIGVVADNFSRHLIESTTTSQTNPQTPHTPAPPNPL